MLKLIKYELRRSLTLLIILFGAIAVLEAYNLVSLFTKNQNNTAISFLLLYLCAIVGVIFIFIMAVMSYSKELGSKYSYMTFMTPTSTYKIIGSKLLSTGLIALFTTIIAVILVTLDYNILLNQFTEAKYIQDSIIAIFTINGVDINNFTVLIFISILNLWISIFTTICLIYFSITLSKTLFSNKSYRWVISTILYFVIVYLLGKITSNLPTVDIGTGMLNLFLQPLLTYLANIIVMILAFFGSGILLDKKVSL